jgi:LysM repeat protein
MTVSASPEIYEKQVITVHTGDTLWDIAADWSGKDEDIREVILRIQKENKLSGSDLAVGQRLVIPVRKTVADVVAEQNERNVGKAQLAAR